MTREELLGRRWAALLPEVAPDVAEAVRRLGAVQAQEYGMGVLAAGLRSGKTRAEVERALDAGEIVRTHVLRPTWHLVAPEDLRWMVELTAPGVTRVSGTGYRQHGLTPEALAAARRLIERSLADGPRTRDQIMEYLAANGLPVDELRPVHYMMDAEQSLLVCSGPRQGKTITYDLVDRRVPAAAPLDREEALARLALRYIRGHGPATDRDFAWWSGLGLIEARRGLNANRGALTTAAYEEAEVWYDPAGAVAPLKGFLWLPAFDESLVAFADRTAVLDASHSPQVLTKNGIFNPFIVWNGRLVGVWKRPPKKPVEALWFGETPPQGEESRARWQRFMEAFDQT